MCGWLFLCLSSWTRTTTSIAVVAPTNATSMQNHPAITEQVTNLFNTVDHTNAVANLSNAVAKLSNSVKNLEDTMNTRFNWIERSVEILQNSARGYGHLVPYNVIMNDAGAPLPLVWCVQHDCSMFWLNFDWRSLQIPIRCAHNLVSLSNTDVSTWCTYLVPSWARTKGYWVCSENGEVGRYIGYHGHVVWEGWVKLVGYGYDYG